MGNTERGHLGDTGADERKILKWIFKNVDGAWTGLTWLRIVVRVAGICECCSKICEEFLG